MKSNKSYFFGGGGRQITSTIRQVFDSDRGRRSSNAGRSTTSGARSAGR